MRRNKIATREVAVSAIGIIHAELELAFLALVRCLMFMFMMAKMLRCLAFFMLTIASHRGPGHLER